MTYYYTAMFRPATGEIQFAEHFEDVKERDKRATQLEAESRRQSPPDMDGKPTEDAWFSYKGTAPTITTKGYTWDGTQRGSTQTSTSAEWLGEQFTGIDYLTLTIAAGAADTQVFGLRVEMDLVA